MRAEDHRDRRWSGEEDGAAGRNVRDHRQRHLGHGQRDRGDGESDKRPDGGAPRQVGRELVGELLGEQTRLPQLRSRIAGDVVGDLGEDALPAPAANAHRAELARELVDHVSTPSTMRAKARHSPRFEASSRRPSAVSR